MDTPWGKYCTRQREEFICWSEGSGVYIGAGNDPNSGVTARFVLGRSQVEVLGPRSSAPEVSPLFRLELPKWTADSTPFVHVHPIALLHLIGTEQVPGKILDEILEATRSPAAFLSYPVRIRCELLTMLGVSQAVIAFDTRSDLAVR